MIYLLYTLTLIGVIGIVYFVQFKRLKRNIDRYVAMDVEMLIGTEEVKDQNLSSSLLFRLQGLDECIKEIVITDVDFRESGVSSNSFENIVFRRNDRFQNIPERSISFSISGAILEKRKDEGIAVQICGYLRDYESKLSKFKVERVAREQKIGRLEVV